jgi:hypothetical protein
MDFDGLARSNLLSKWVIMVFGYGHSNNILQKYKHLAPMFPYWTLIDL